MKDEIGYILEKLQIWDSMADTESADPKACKRINISEANQALLSAIIGCEPEKEDSRTDRYYLHNNAVNEYTKNIRKLFGEK